MDIITIVVISVLIVSSGIGLGIWFFLRSTYKHTFLKINADFSGITELKAKLVRDEENSSVMKFKIKDYDELLEKRSPNWLYKNKPCWLVSVDDNANLIYVEPKKAFVKDLKKYYEFELMPEERSAISHRVAKANVKYSPENNFAKFVLVSTIIFFVMGLIFNSYAVYQNVKIANTYSESKKIDYDNTKLQNENIKLLNEINKRIYEDFPQKVRSTTISLVNSTG